MCFALSVVAVVVRFLFGLLLCLAVPVFAVSDPWLAVYPRAEVGGWYPHGVDEQLGHLRGVEIRELRARVGSNAHSSQARKAMSAEVKALNDRIPGQLPTGPGADITLKEISKIRNSILDHPVVGSPGLSKYDPSFEVGFCFGRATYVHLELLDRGVPAHQIAKIFAIGNLRHRGRPWRFHVATMVQVRGGKWWVIDDLQREPLTVSDWMAAVNAMDLHPTTPTLRYYVTDPAKFQPASGAYDRKVLTEPLFGTYFEDLAAPYLLKMKSKVSLNKN